jgi:hypothetical protein
VGEVECPESERLPCRTSEACEAKRCGGGKGERGFRGGEGCLYPSNSCQDACSLPRVASLEWGGHGGDHRLWLEWESDQYSLGWSAAMATRARTPYANPSQHPFRIGSFLNLMYRTILADWMFIPCCISITPHREHDRLDLLVVGSGHDVDGVAAEDGVEGMLVQ